MKNNLKKTYKKKSGIHWTLFITFISFFLTIAFSLISELINRTSSIVSSAIIVLTLIVLNIVFDMIATAMASVERSPFVAMSSKKVRGAKEVLFLIKNTDKVCSICGDVVGDICGIVAGAATSAIIYNVFINKIPGQSQLEMWMTIVFSAVVACLTIGGKAVGKSLAIRKSKDIILFVGYLISFVKKQDKVNGKQNQ